MTQITVHFDKPNNTPGVCDELHSYLERLGEWEENAVADDRAEDADVLRELIGLIDRLIGNLEGV
jgi:hypothetical protein